MKRWQFAGSVHWLAICLLGCGSAFTIGPGYAQDRENLAPNLAQRVAAPANGEPLKKGVISCPVKDLSLRRLLAGGS
ncbi:hypothetical protein DP113_20010 [Brasilonema octagenarum UFV-E1]|uniref:Uncharacterized protein n=1 Tax=Brasilonema sennae CENA114 TaxID=415709 RepID=A0A856MLS2_9CYAN|nr:hypothetical protein [Brasilonema sennae]QDL09876.1 hypothetical protein DP114_20095 [Brasilonema sennae CENA114]QDL16226.1 hypothetical protein DP113_20010 [Brasilonema octagenarum UFV-E1]